MTQLVDLSRIQETSDGDTEFEQELIEMYVDDAMEHLQAIASAHQAGDALAIKRAAHTLKGSSANVGAIAVQEIAAEIESLGGAEDLSGIAPHIPEINQAFEKVKAFFEDYFSNQ